MSTEEKRQYVNDAVELLKALIAIPRISRNEAIASNLIEEWMTNWGLNPKREANNLWAVADNYNEAKPTLLLNAHIDTVKPVQTWTRNPHQPSIEDDRLYGLGSNDCGGGLVTLMQVYRILKDSDRQYNLVFVASAEEEVSGKNGIERVLPLLPKIDVAIVGEPTGMQPAIAEKGLMVIDGYAKGVSGHAARNEGVNAIYEALDDLMWLRDYRFRKESPLLGATKMTVTQVESGTQHNVIPDVLHFVIDVRTNEFYQNEYVFAFLQKQMKRCELKVRSFRLHSSSIAEDHPLVKRCTDLGLKPFGSPTLSDQALMPFPSFKLGPGESARSHSADEFICISEIEQALETYLKIIP
ncbi:M20 family metallo-hydrolase [uncultured Prevotella sp.]|jgi:acetylornithine deacetylase|uniref:M20 family metallo-hydrolase n=1 Tax=uncultured Prevotella sp. TaxID=159272 RepID=UPI0025F08411|nr:M20 family metallo-hydrolase [uncultured Prevotella sp.]